MIEFEHEIAITENGVNYSELPLNIKGKINRFNQDKAKVYADPENVNPDKELILKKSSLIIAEDIQDWIERDLEEETEEKLDNPNPNNMKTKEEQALIDRAKACGLPETATEAEITAKENENTAAATKANELKARAKAAGLAETATEDEIVAAETAKSDTETKANALKARAKAAGLAESATEAEIEAKEKEVKTPKVEKKPVAQEEDLMDELF